MKSEKTGGAAFERSIHNNIPATAAYYRSEQPQVSQIQLYFGVNGDMTDDKDVIDLLIIYCPDALIVYLSLNYLIRYLTVFDINFYLPRSNDPPSLSILLSRYWMPVTECANAKIWRRECDIFLLSELTQT